MYFMLIGGMVYGIAIPTLETIETIEIWLETIEIWSETIETIRNLVRNHRNHRNLVRNHRNHQKKLSYPKIGYNTSIGSSHGTDPSLRVEEVQRPGGSKVLPWLTQPEPTAENGNFGENRGEFGLVGEK